MQPWKMFLSRLLVAPLAIMILSLGVTEAAQKTTKQPPPLQDSAIVGEVDDGDTFAIDELNEDENGSDIAADEPPPTKPKANKPKNKKKDKKREKLLEGFKKAEDFHKTWFNLPSPKIKTSLGNLTKFCKIACTASQCKDEEIAHNCHLICPTATTKKCPDPLKKAGAANSGAAKEIDEMEAMGNSISVAPLSHPHVSSDLLGSIHEGDSSMLVGDEGEGG